jgi:hypothetical protein
MSKGPAIHSQGLLLSKVKKETKEDRIWNSIRLSSTLSSDETGTQEGKNNTILIF